MFTSYSRLVIVGLSAIGLAGWAAAQEAQDGGASASAEQPAASAAGSTGKTASFVLLTDGRLVTGVVSEDDSTMVVTQPIGAMRFPKKRIEKVFPGIQDVYAYKLELLPENDFDERIKLARWCLEHKLEAQAREQLGAILERSPKHAQARAMLVSLDQAKVRQSNRMRDPEVRQTKGEQVPAADARPNSLDASIISGARRGMGIPDLPVIFDLPPAQAVKRAEEFARYVHPVLQAQCARCHNEQYDGAFQLVPFKTKLDRTREAFAANLDATLKLVDRENPTRSDLLSSTLRPHGRGPNMRPIFQGSNDPAYRILASWIFKLQAAKPTDEVMPAKLSAPEAAPREVFASARGRATPDVESSVAAPQRFSTGPVETKVLPPVRFDPAKGMVPETKLDPDEFPLPFAVGGSKPKTSAIPPPRTMIPSGSKVLPSKPASSLAAEGPGTKASAEDRSDDQTAESAAAATEKPRKKPLKLDPTILQRALQLKNQNRSGGG
jgi:hypothetical protein